MAQNKLETMFAAPERASDGEIKRVFRQVMETPLLAQLLDAAPGGILVLNAERQIVFANRSILHFAGLTEPDAVLGVRPGEALRCIHSDEMPAGCGTSVFCTTCGVVKAILASQKGKADIQECRILRQKTGEALDLRAQATPLLLNNNPLTIFALLDISDEKRRKALERIFFHDILNTASGMKGFAELLQDASPEETSEYKQIIASLSRMIVDEINSQRTLTAAENNELTITPSAVQSLELLQELMALYQHHDIAKDRRLQLAAGSEDIALTTDRALLQRVIGNMIKNALEAIQPGQAVTTGCGKQGEQVEFWVHNPNTMPAEVQLQIFQRSFSTKGGGRGLGTYSIKLLSERYLKGAVSFSSDKDGTVFRARYPLIIN